MTLLKPGIRLVNAPRFHSVRPWIDRLSLNSGVVHNAGRILARDDWRPLTPEELALLTATGGDLAEALVLFNIPERLHARWWVLVADESGDAAFQEFGREVIEFLQFKQLPLPAKCTVSAVVHVPGLASTKPNAGGLTADPACAGMLAGINLSDEEATLVFLNLGAVHLAALVPKLSLETTGESLREQAHAFLTAGSDYPVIRVALQPGEGFWLPRMPIAHDGDTRGRIDVDVQLRLRGE